MSKITNKNLQLKSASDIKALAIQNPDKASLEILQAYAIEKREFLKSKAKYHRARLWENAIADIEKIAPVTVRQPAPIKTSKPAKNKPIKKEGMKAVKIGGVKQWIHEGIGPNGLSMLRQTINALGRTTISQVKRQEEAYEYWKRTGEQKPLRY